MNREKLINNNQVIVDLGLEVIKIANESNIPVRMFGGCAFWYLCRNSRNWLISNSRKIKDIDLVCLFSNFPILLEIFKKMKFVECTNKYNFTIHKRRQFNYQDILVEVVFDHLNYCHKIDLQARIKLSYPTISYSDLFLSKLQNINFMKTKNDYLDILAFLNEDFISENEFKKLNNVILILSNDWRFYRTVTTNLKELNEFIKGNSQLPNVVNNIDYLLSSISSSDKTIKWKITKMLPFYDRSIEVE